MTDLFKLVSLERLGDSRFRGWCQQGKVGRLFGGHVAAHAVWAGSVDAPEGMFPQSVHVHFLRAGVPDQPVHYDVTTIKHGRSLWVQSVVASQPTGPILSGVVSLHRSEPGPQYQDVAPMVEPPEHFARSTFFPPGSDPQTRAMFDYRYGDDPGTEATPMEPRQRTWFRAVGAAPADPVVQAALLTYASDLTLTRTAHRPLRAVTSLRLGSSLDHVVWFHRPAVVTDWLLFDQTAVSYAGSRALSQGRMFDRSGRFVASVAQEALIRLDGP